MWILRDICNFAPFLIFYKQMKITKIALALVGIAVCVAIPFVSKAGISIHDGNACTNSSTISSIFGAFNHEGARKMKYEEISYPTPNYDSTKTNEVKGVVLHHTAEPTAQRSLEVLTSKERGVSTHVVIDYDGTRYIMLPPTTVAWHAGASLHAGREKCNEWMLGIEFQGDTTQEPLTQDQIDSAIEWLLPLIAQYNIPIDNIVTHQMIRTAYKKKHPEKRAYDKPDITQTEYVRFMKQLRAALEE